MASAGVIQFVTTGLLSTWTGLMSEDSGYYWIAYLVGLVLSVVWSFTFNRKFTFKAASNLPLAMVLVALYYCAFAPLSTFGADAIVKAWQAAAGDGWNQNYEMVITVGMMLINFVTEFVWEKFVVFNDRVMAKIERKLHIKHKEKPAEEAAIATEEQTAPVEQTTETATEETPATEKQTPPPEEE
ncbi:MAG: GtrA family protein [Clostridia bacterium]|nr:GtrA family protein [Clostridia bacterium]